MYCPECGNILDLNMCNNVECTNYVSERAREMTKVFAEAVKVETEKHLKTGTMIYDESGKLIIAPWVLEKNK